MEHEALGGIAQQGVVALLIASGAEGGDCQSRGLTAAEEHGTVGLLQQAGFDGQRANRGGVAAVNALAFFHDALANDFLGHIADDIANSFELGFVFGEFFGNSFLCLFLCSVLGCITNHLLRGGQCFLKVFGDEVAQKFNDFLILLGGSDFELGYTDFLAKLVLNVEERHDLLMAPGQSIGNDVFGDELSATLNHDHGVAGCREDEVQGRLLFNTFIRRIQNKLVVHVSDTGTNDGAEERHLGDVAGCGSTSQRQNVRIDVFVSGQNGCNDLYFVGKTFCEERTNRTVDEAGNQGFVLGRTSFTTEVVTRNATGGVCHFLIVTGQREEAAIDGKGLGNGSNQYGRIAGRNGNCAACLSGVFTGFNSDVDVADICGDTGRIKGGQHIVNPPM